jgi:hypothetical protein
LFIIKSIQFNAEFQLYRFLLVLCIVLSAGTLGVSAAIPVETQQVTTRGWFDEVLTWPLFQWFSPANILPLADYVLEPAAPPCMIEPLAELTDPDALLFELSRGSDGAVQTDGLTAATAKALNRFESIVVSVGGTVTLTSAYRPPAYQAHLQNVWDKWMLEMRDVNVEQCQQLRSEVETEFREHGLLETQRPASISDHTRGMAFDATILLPRITRRINADALARRAGLFRPVAAQDPVHFRIGTRRTKGLRARVTRRGNDNRVSKQV